MEQFQNYFGLDGAAAGGTSLVFVSLSRPIPSIVMTDIGLGSLHCRSSMRLLLEHLLAGQSRTTMGHVHPKHPSMVSIDPTTVLRTRRLT